MVVMHLLRAARAVGRKGEGDVRTQTRARLVGPRERAAARGSAKARSGRRRRQALGGGKGAPAERPRAQAAGAKNAAKALKRPHAPPVALLDAHVDFSAALGARGKWVKARDLGLKGRHGFGKRG